MISPFSWLEEYTPKEEWVGAQKDVHGNEVSSSDAFQAYMKAHLPELTLQVTKQVPFLIREHERKYQYGVSECTVWKKVNVHKH